MLDRVSQDEDRYQAAIESYEARLAIISDQQKIDYFFENVSEERQLDFLSGYEESITSEEFSSEIVNVFFEKSDFHRNRLMEQLGI